MGTTEVSNRVDPATPPLGRWYRTAKFWKRFSVFASITLSVVSLILSAIASLKTESPHILKALIVSGIVVNSISISLSALTSLDWKKKATNDREFAVQLCKVAHVHEGEHVIIKRKPAESDSS